jgi:serine/threonine protein kinase
MPVAVIDRYEIRRGLGRGAMGSVYLAYDAKLQREVAIKVLQKEFAASAKYRTRFEREAHSIAALKHPNIVEIYDYGGSPEEYLYLVMEYIRGPHVGKLCREHSPFPESVLAAIGSELAAALSCAHGAGIIHRDLKPENVFVDRGRLVLADFGIVKAITADSPLGAAAASPRTDIVGTPGFMAPEQLTQEQLDPRADLFSLGALLYYLATMKPPFEADSPYALLKEFQASRPQPLSVLRADLSDELCALVHGCIDTNREHRPKDAEVVRQQLRSVLDGVGARDVRDILARFETDAPGFRKNDTERTLAHLVEELKIAVRDHDGVRIDLLRRRIATLDPLNAEAQHVTGADMVMHDQGPLPAPTPTRHRREWRRLAWPITAVIISTLAVGLALWIARPSSPVPSVIEAPRIDSVAVLEVRARSRTRVLLNGTELGVTPGFAPATIPSGSVELEFVSERHGRIKDRFEVPLSGRLSLFVDWKHRKVRNLETRGP